MDFHHLKYFVEVADQKSFSKAARNLHISQSAISRTIKALEDELGVVLFMRNAKSVELTDGGTIFLTHAKRVVFMFEHLKTDFENEFRLEQGSINLYMFHGGTNFGFMNGCSARGTLDLPQVTSYDYDALLDEEGNPTAKYLAVKKMMATHFPEYPQLEPLYKESMKVDAIPLAEKVSLFETLDSLSSPVESLYPKKMEELGQSYGYLLYRTETNWDAEEERLRIIDGRDRAQLYVDGQWVETQYQTEIGEDIFYQGEKKALSRLDILIENMGRVNYGHKFLADTQRKGIRTGVCKDLHFLLNWKHYPLPLDNPERIDFSKGWAEGQPAFYAYDFTVEDPKDTYLDLSEFGKGVAFVNGQNLGRFWNVGPTLSLYIPHSYLKEGANRIIIFETEGEYKEEIHLTRKPTLKHIKGENL